MNNLSTEDITVIAMTWLAISNLGFRVQDLDLSEPGYIQRCGPHTIYSFAIRLRDDEAFPKDDFCRLMNHYSEISNPVKPHCYGIEEFPSQVFRFDPADGTGKSTPLENYHDVYVSVFT